ncbi:MAG: patatin-like phospholipase family protein [Pseudomonadales bacterium]
MTDTATDPSGETTPADRPASAGRKVGLALGGGGAKGLAHIPMLQALDAAGVRPVAIAGTSIGAIMGTLYASGASGDEIHAGITELVAMPKTLQEAFEAKQLFAWLEFFDLNISRGSLFQVDRFLDHLEDLIGVSRFEDLEIPLKVVATDFWAREEVVFDRGPIIPAVAASFAMPGIFKPVVQDDRVLVDGGSVNPLPYDLLEDDCDLLIAIDVMGQRAPEEDQLPSYTESVFNTFQIAEKSILREKFRRRKPDIYIEVEVTGVRALEFHKVDHILRQAEPARERLQQALADLDLSS